MFYQLKWFDPTHSDAVIASQAGVLHASFTAAQFLTAMLWGRVADSPYAGRKTVLMIGLVGTSQYSPNLTSPALSNTSLTLVIQPISSPHGLWIY